MSHARKQESMDHTQEIKKLIEAIPLEVQLLNLLDKDFKLAIINMLRELKETMSKELKKDMNAKTTYCITPFILSV